MVERLVRSRCALITAVHYALSLRNWPSQRGTGQLLGVCMDDRSRDRRTVGVIRMPVVIDPNARQISDVITAPTAHVEVLPRGIVVTNSTRNVVGRLHKDGLTHVGKRGGRPIVAGGMSSVDSFNNAP